MPTFYCLTFFFFFFFLFKKRKGGGEGGRRDIRGRGSSQKKKLNICMIYV